MNKYYELQNECRVLEQELISEVFNDLHLIQQVNNILSPEDFVQYGKEYSVLLTCYHEQKNVTNEFIASGLRMSDFVIRTTIRPIEVIAQDILENANSRRALFTLQKAVDDFETGNVNGFISDVQKKLIDSISQKGRESDSIDLTINDYKTLQNLYHEKAKKGELIGTSTGYTKLDTIVDGFRPEHLWVVGGYTNMGKTFASLNFAANLIKQGKRVIFYSLEMSKVDIMSRILGILTRDSGLSILKGYARDKSKLEEAFELLSKSNSVIFTGKTDLSEIQMSMHEQSLKQPVDLFIVDFIQLMSVKGAKSEYESITAAATGLQTTAKKLKSTIMVLSQISNDGARHQDQDVMTFKGSGAIASAADLAIEIVRSGENKQEWLDALRKGDPVPMKWIVRKNRHGSVGYLDMMFRGRFGTFDPGDELDAYSNG
jgi:replicative DNA helicase